MQTFLNRWMPFASERRGWGVPLAAAACAVLFLISLTVLDAMDGVRLQPSRNNIGAKLDRAMPVSACGPVSSPMHFHLQTPI